MGQSGVDHSFDRVLAWRLFSLCISTSLLLDSLPPLPFLSSPRPLSAFDNSQDACLYPHRPERDSHHRGRLADGA